MLRTWLVRLLAMKLTLSVNPFQVAGHVADVGLASELAVRADFRGHAGDLGRRRS